MMGVAKNEKQCKGEEYIVAIPDMQESSTALQLTTMQAKLWATYNCVFVCSALDFSPVYIYGSGHFTLILLGTHPPAQKRPSNHRNKCSRMATQIGLIQTSHLVVCHIHTSTHCPHACTCIHVQKTNKLLHDMAAVTGSMMINIDTYQKWLQHTQWSCHPPTPSQTTLPKPGPLKTNTTWHDDIFHFQ